VILAGHRDDEVLAAGVHVIGATRRPDFLS
jgi:hypothetical protein